MSALQRRGGKEARKEGRTTGLILTVTGEKDRNISPSLLNELKRKDEGRVNSC